jgi:hypothetical protein
MKTSIKLFVLFTFFLFLNNSIFASIDRPELIKSSFNKVSFVHPQSVKVPDCLSTALAQLDILYSYAGQELSYCYSVSTTPSNCGQLYFNFLNAGLTYIENGVNNCEHIYSGRN